MSPSIDAARRGRLTAAIGLLVTTLCWGSTVPITAELLQSFDPLLVAPARYALATPILLVFSWIVDRGKPWPHYLPWLRMLYLGASVALFVSLVAFGIYYSDPITAIAIFATGPVVALAMSWLADRRRLSSMHLLAVALAVAGGIIAAIYKPGSALGLGFRGGELLLLAGIVCWTWYSMKAQAWLAPLGFTQIRLTFVELPGGTRLARRFLSRRPRARARGAAARLRPRHGNARRARLDGVRPDRARRGALELRQRDHGRRRLHALRQPVADRRRRSSACCCSAPTRP